MVMNYAPSIGGAQSLVQQLAEGLTGLGHDVEVLTTDAQRSAASLVPGVVDAPSRERLNGVLVKRYPLARRSHRVLRDLRRARGKAERLLGRPRRHRPSGPVAVGPHGLRLVAAIARATRERDVVVGVGLPYITLVGLGLLPQRGRSARIAMPLHHDRPGHSYSRLTIRGLERFDGYVAASAFEVGELVALGARPEHTVVLSPGCEPARYPDLEPSEARRRLGLPDHPTVGYLGRLTAYKGVDTLLAAIPAILADHPDTCVLVAGARQGWSELDDLLGVASSAAGGRLIVREGFDEDAKPLLLAACDVVVCPSREESFGMVNIEAWAAGRPVVTGDIPAVRSLVNSGTDGFLVPVGDPGALAQRVNQLLADPDLARSLGADGRKRVVEEFDWDLVVRRWDVFLGSVEHRVRRHRASRGRQEGPSDSAVRVDNQHPGPTTRGSMKR